MQEDLVNLNEKLLKSREECKKVAAELIVSINNLFAGTKYSELFKNAGWGKTNIQNLTQILYSMAQQGYTLNIQNENIDFDGVEGLYIFIHVVINVIEHYNMQWNNRDYTACFKYAEYLKYVELKKECCEKFKESLKKTTFNSLRGKKIEDIQNENLDKKVSEALIQAINNSKTTEEIDILWEEVITKGNGWVLYKNTNFTDKCPLLWCVLHIIEEKIQNRKKVVYLFPLLQKLLMQDLRRPNPHCLSWCTQGNREIRYINIMHQVFLLASQCSENIIFLNAYKNTLKVFGETAILQSYVYKYIAFPLVDSFIEAYKKGNKKSIKNLMTYWKLFYACTMRLIEREKESRFSPRYIKEIVIPSLENLSITAAETNSLADFPLKKIIAIIKDQELSKENMISVTEDEKKVYKFDIGVANTDNIFITAIIKFLNAYNIKDIAGAVDEEEILFLKLCGILGIDPQQNEQEFIYSLNALYFLQAFLLRFPNIHYLFCMLGAPNLELEYIDYKLQILLKALAQYHKFSYSKKLVNSSKNIVLIESSKQIAQELGFLPKTLSNRLSDFFETHKNQNLQKMDKMQKIENPLYVLLKEHLSKSWWCAYTEFYKSLEKKIHELSILNSSDKAARKKNIITIVQHIDRIEELWKLCLEYFKAYIPTEKEEIKKDLSKVLYHISAQYLSHKKNFFSNKYQTILDTKEKSIEEKFIAVLKEYSSWHLFQWKTHRTEVSKLLKEIENEKIDPETIQELSDKLWNIVRTTGELMKILIYFEKQFSSDKERQVMNTRRIVV